MHRDLLPGCCYADPERRPLREVGGVIVHYVSAVNVEPDLWDQYESIRNLLLDLNREPGARQAYGLPDLDGRVYASYHELILRDGTTYQLVPYEAVAYHAGKSELGGRAGCNDWTLGIALVATASSGFTDAQYTALAQRIVHARRLDQEFSLNHVAGHDEVARPRGRKADPGSRFDWRRLRELLERET